MKLNSVALTLRSAAGVLVVFVATEALAVTAQTATVKGRPPVAGQLQVINTSAPGLNPAQGDTLEIAYQFHDPDGLQESPSETLFRWLADEQVISGANERLYTPGPAQNKRYLTVKVLPVEIEPSDPDRPDAPFVSPNANAPVLPARADLSAAFHYASPALRWGDAYMHCANNGMRLPDEGDLQDMFVTYTRANRVGQDSKGDLRHTYGIAGRNAIWTTRALNDTHHAVINAFTDGRSSAAANASRQTVVCAQTGIPDMLPAIVNLAIPAPREGEDVTLSYLYQGNETIPDRSRFQWFRADNAAGTARKTAIPGAVEKSYTPVAEDVNRYLVVEATPASYDTVMGTMVSTVSEQVAPGGSNVLPGNTTIHVNGATFDTDSGFPRSGLVGASFQLRMNGNAASNREYSWHDDRSWLSVDDKGVVTFNRRPEGAEKTATITIRSKNDGGSYAYTFTVTKWLITDGNPTGFNNDWCGKQDDGYRRPTAEESTRNGERAASTGRWWSEWGPLYNFGGNWVNAPYWIDELGSKNTLNMSNGIVTNSRKSSHVVCIADVN